MTSKCAKCGRSIGGVFNTVHWEIYNDKKYCEKCLSIVQKREPKKQKIIDKKSEEEANLKWYFKLSRNIYRILFYTALISLFGVPFTEHHGILSEEDIFSFPTAEFVTFFLVYALMWFLTLLVPFIFGYYIPNKQLKKDKENREEILEFILIPCWIVLIPLFFRITQEFGLNRLISSFIIISLVIIFIL